MLSRTGRLNKRFIFKEKGEPTTGINGTKVYPWPIKGKAWGSVMQKTITQIENEVGGMFEDTTTIVIRQRQDFTPELDWRVEIDRKDFDIIKINPDIYRRGFMVIFVKAVA